MGEKSEMEKVTKQLREKVKQIDMLVHNAGCMIHEKNYNKDGVETNFATNTFALFYLTRLLLPLLHKESRVITVSSGGMLTQKLVTDDLYMDEDKFDGTTQYARNKRQQICIT
jgi:dehydrogenase/reductase SDR family protein 12